MNRKKGFTLVEVVVALAVSTILLGTVSLSLFLITKMSNTLIEDSSNLYKISTVRDYIVNNNITDKNLITITDGDVKINNKDIVINSQITNIEFTVDLKTNYNICHITYGNDNYSFIIPNKGGSAI